MNTYEMAYIAGFFNGDGSVRIQFQPRKDSRFGFRVRAEISFAQKTGHDRPMLWIREKIGIGYIYNRNDGMSELKIEGFTTVKSILESMQPFIRFKEKQVTLVLKALSLLDKKSKDVTFEDLILVAEIADQISKNNYVTVKKKYTASFIKENIRRYTPVTTDPTVTVGEK